MPRLIGAALWAVIILSATLEAQSVFNYPGAGVIQAGDLWESFLPQGVANTTARTSVNYGESGSASTLGVRILLRMGNFDRWWSTPGSHWPAAYPVTPYWFKNAMVFVYDPDPTFNPAMIGGAANPSYFSVARNTAGDYSEFAQLTFMSTLQGANDPIRKYSIEPYWVDGIRRQHAVYEAAWPTNLGIDVKMRTHGFQGPNWNNLNDFVIVEVELKNTGVVDMNMDGVAEKVANEIKALAFQLSSEAYMSISSYGGGGRNVNDIVPAPIARQACWITDPDETGSPWAFQFYRTAPTTSYPTAGNWDHGFNGGTTKNYTDVYTGWVMIDAKIGPLPANRGESTTGLPTKYTIYGTHPIGTGTQRGWYVSGGSNRFNADPNVSDPRKMFYVATAAFYTDCGRYFSTTAFPNYNLSPNAAIFSSGTAGDPLSFVPKSPGLWTRPTGDLKSTGLFDQVSTEDGVGYPAGYGRFSSGASHTENFDGNAYSGIGPFSLKKDSTITLVFATVAGYRLEGIQKAVRAARWVYANNYALPQLPPLPEMRVVKVPIGFASVEWDNRAEGDGEFAGYKIWRSAKKDSTRFLDEGMRISDRYQEQMTPGARPSAVLKPVNPKFDAFAKTLATATRGVYASDTWGTWTLQRTILRSDLGSLSPGISPGYAYSWIDSTAPVGADFWYYVSAFKEGTYAGPGGESATRIETHSTNRNGATGLWYQTYPFAFSNVNFPKDPEGRKNIGAGIQLRPPLSVDRLNFGTVNLGGARTLPVKIVNTADDSLRVDLTSSRGSFVPLFSSLVIPPADDTTIAIRFTPIGTDADSGLVILSCNGRPGKDTIAVSGGGGTGAQRAVVAWDRYLDSTQVIPSGAAIALDPSGNIYAADIIHGSAPTRTGITKYDPTGTPLWKRRDSIAAGFPMVVGLNAGADQSLYLVTNGPTSSPSSGAICIGKFSGAGSLLWRQAYMPASTSLSANAFAVDQDRSVIATGYGMRSPGSNSQIHTVKYNSDGALQWVAIYDGPVIATGDSTDTPNALAVDATGNVFVAGTTSSSTYSRSNIVVLKYSPLGVQQWVNIFNGPGNGTDVAADIAVDFNGDVYVVGGSTGLTTGRDIAVLKFRGTDGALLWSDLFDGPAHSDDVATACLVVQNNTMVVSGTVGAPPNGSSAVLLRYNIGGLRSEMLQYGGPSGVAFGGGLVEDQNGSLFFSGRCTGALGSTECFAFKLDDLGRFQWEAQYAVSPTTNTQPADLAAGGDGSLFLSGQFATPIGYQYFVTKLGEIPSPVVQDAATLPASVELQQNFPNPFNPSTVIRYALPSKCQITLTVYNLLGQSVTTLAQGEREAGRHEVRFDGSGLASGVYFYRLQAGDVVQSRKLVLIK